MARVLVTGGAGTIGAAVVRRLLRDPDWEVRVSDHREPPEWMREGCELHHGRSARARRGPGRAGRLLARDPSGGDRRRDRQLPQAPVHADRGQQRADRRGRPRRGRAGRRRGWSTSPPRWCSSARPSTRPPRPTSTPAPPRARPTASPSWPARSTRAPPTTSTACATRSAGPSTPTGPASSPIRDEPGIAHAVPDLIAKVLVRPAAAADLRQRRADADADPRRRHRRRRRHRDGLAGGRERGLQHLGFARS